MNSVVLEGFGLLPLDPESRLLAMRSVPMANRTQAKKPLIQPINPRTRLMRPRLEGDSEDLAMPTRATLPGNTGIMPPRLAPEGPLARPQSDTEPVESIQVLPQVTALPGITPPGLVAVATVPPQSVPLPSAAPVPGLMDQVGAWFDQELIPGVANKWLAAGVGGLVLVLLLTAKRGD